MKNPQHCKRTPVQTTQWMVIENGWSHCCHDKINTFIHKNSLPLTNGLHKTKRMKALVCNSMQKQKTHDKVGEFVFFMETNKNCSELMNINVSVRDQMNHFKNSSFFLNWEATVQNFKSHFGQMKIWQTSLHLPMHALQNGFQVCCDMLPCNLSFDRLLLHQKMSHVLQNELQQHDSNFFC